MGDRCGVGFEEGWRGERRGSVLLGVEERRGGGGEGVDIYVVVR